MVERESIVRPTTSKFVYPVLQSAWGGHQHSPRDDDLDLQVLVESTSATCSVECKADFLGAAGQLGHQKVRTAGAVGCLKFETVLLLFVVCWRSRVY
jgi:hypothetical protein